MYDTTANLAGNFGWACDTDLGNGTQVPPSASKCKNVFDTNGTNKVAAGWTYFTKAALTNFPTTAKANGGNPFLAMLCAQADDACDKSAGFGSKKIATFASASDAAKTVVLTDKLDQ